MNPSNGRAKAIVVVALLVAAELMRGEKSEDDLMNLIRGICPDETAALAVAMTVADLMGVQIDAVQFTVKSKVGDV